MSTIVIPIDASQVPEKDRGQQKVKVAVREGGKTQSTLVSVAAGKTEARLDVSAKQGLEIAVGPATASDEDIFRLRTLTASVSPAQFGKEGSLTISPIVVTPIYWQWWWIWCREFTITGQVVCADGSPVPGAQVSALNVDFWWWWSSIFQVGSTAVTDSNGNFTITFRWCCGWWPWWWWDLRCWRLDPLLVDKLYPVLQLHPELSVRPPSVKPTLDLVALKAKASRGGALVAPSIAGSQPVTPELISSSRAKLIGALPNVPEFANLNIWPWVEWFPWFDCSPNIIFQVTQNCNGAQNNVIVGENIFQARWDIPTNLNVTLTANQNACCISQGNPPPEGNCFLMTEVCNILVTQIGGNAGAVGPVGFAYPNDRDRPFAESISLWGQFGTGAVADYYSIQYRPHGTVPWSPVPVAALQSFTRSYFDASLPCPACFAPPVTFAPTAGVYESRDYYQTTNPGPGWGSPSGRSWMGDPDELAVISTDGFFTDGAYDFSVIAYPALGSGGPDLTKGVMLNGCGVEPDNDNIVVVQLNNRVASAIPESVHINTTQPNCGITAVRLGGTPVLPCGAQPLTPGTSLEIDFFVTDSAAFLDDYSLVVLYGSSSEINLLDPCEVGTFSFINLGPGVSVGPDYSNAVGVPLAAAPITCIPPASPYCPESAVRPIWGGGSMTLHIDNAANVFPQTCCYLIQLVVWKRNIVNCSTDLTYYNQSDYSFTVTV
jgi:hypothetical protein